MLDGLRGPGAPEPAAGVDGLFLTRGEAGAAFGRSLARGEAGLALPGELERFLSVEEATTLRGVFAGLWSLAGPAEPAADAPADEHVAAMHMRLAQERPSEYVMKPQREGMSDLRSGAHNLFGTELA